MASTYTSILRLELQANGENDTTWGTKANSVFSMIEEAIAGRAAITHSDAANYSLTTANSATDESRPMILNIAGALTAARNTVAPTKSKVYVAKNATTGGFATTLKTTAGTGIAIPNGKTTFLMCDGTNVVNAIDYLNALTAGTLGVRSSGAAFDLQLASSEVLTANRALTVSLGDAARTLTISSSTTLAGGTHGGTNTGDQTITLTGDVTGTGNGSFVATIANDAVTYAKMQNVSATSRILGRITAAAGDAEELTAANVKTILALAAGDISGLAAIATSGSASDLGSGTIPSARVTSVDAACTINAFVLGYVDVPRRTSGFAKGECMAVSAGQTLNTSDMATSRCFSLYNDSASTITLTQGAGVTLRKHGTATTGNLTVAIRGMVTIWCNSGTEAIAIGDVS